MSSTIKNSPIYQDVCFLKTPKEFMGFPLSCVSLLSILFKSILYIGQQTINQGKHTVSKISLVQ